MGFVARMASKHRIIGVGLWFTIVSGYALFSAENNRQRLADEVEETGQNLRRLISQRVTQHDAHMTSLIAITSGASPAPSAAVRQVMESIERFYPRVVGIELVSLEERSTDTPEVAVLLKVPEVGNADIASFHGRLAKQAPGQIAIYQSGNGHYLVAKRSSSLGSVIVVLSIDAQHLIEGDERPSWAAVQLMIDGKLLLDMPAQDGSIPKASFYAPLRFASVIDGEKQRLSFTVDRPVPPAVLLPLRPLVGFALTTGLALVAAMFALRQRSMAMRLRREMDEAAARAVLDQRETLLVHASRVNAMGEMASGIVHELTQPLTAILSHSQAAIRLSSADVLDIKRISSALEANVREAKRAGELLKRMRDYASNRAPNPVRVMLDKTIAEIVSLAGIDLRQRGIRLDFISNRQSAYAIADPVELEQVLHNLIRNAAEALDHVRSDVPLIRIETQFAEREAKIIVTDNGPGISADALPRLFHPFFTTKPSGMGLGLSLCTTLVERVGGRLDAENVPNGGARFIVTLPSVIERQQHEQV